MTVPLAPSASPSSQAQAIVRPVVNIIVPNNRADELSTEGQYNMLTRGEAICMPIRTYVSEKMSKTNGTKQSAEGKNEERNNGARNENIIVVRGKTIRQTVRK